MGISIEGKNWSSRTAGAMTGGMQDCPEPSGARTGCATTEKCVIMYLSLSKGTWQRPDVDPVKVIVPLRMAATIMNAIPRNDSGAWSGVRIRKNSEDRNRLGSVRSGTATNNAPNTTVSSG